MDTPNNKLIINNISKSYAKRLVVSSASFYVDSGEIVGLLGPNGAGKTTCFYIACGLIKTDSGSISLNGEDMTKLPIDKRAKLGLGYLAQEASIFRGLSVADNIMSTLECVSTLNKKQQQKRLVELLLEFNIKHIEHTLGQALSGGERRRVEVARTVALSPKFILLDEPFSGVDPIAVGNLQHLIISLKDRGIGILITDHNFREMLDICDRTYVLSDGKVIAHGNKEDILNNDLVRQKYLGGDTSSKQVIPPSSNNDISPSA